MKQRGIIWIPVLVIILAVTAFSAAAIIVYKEKQKNFGVSCTAEAKLCPDGSYVGRVAPACVFAACPTTNENVNSTSNINVFTNTANANSTVNTNVVINNNTSNLPDDTVDWQTYTSEMHGFRVEFPTAYYLDEEFGSENSLFWMQAKDDYRARIKVADSASIPEYAYDYPPLGNIVLGGEQGKQFNYQYCDGPGCSEKTVLYIVIHEGKQYSLELVGDYTIDETEQRIIDSFTFTE